MRRKLVYLLVLAWSAAAVVEAAVTVSPSSVTISPGQATPLITGRVLTTLPTLGGTGTLEVALPAALASSLTVEPDPVTYSWPTGGGSSVATTFRLRSTAAAPPGLYALTIKDLTLGAGSTTFSLRILQPGFSGSIEPRTAALVLGGDPEKVAVSTLPEPAFALPVTWRIVGLPGFVRTGGPRTASGPPYPPVAFDLTLGAGATTGTFRGTVRGEAPGLPARELLLTVTVQPPTFDALPTPQPLELVAGGSGRLTVGTRAPAVSSGSITYSVVGLPAGLASTAPRAATAPAFPAVSFDISAAPGTPAGAYTARVRGEFNPGRVVRETAIRLLVSRPRPRIDQVSPAALTAGALEQRLEVLGANFEPGARIVSSSGSLRVGPTRFVSATRLSAPVDVAERLSRAAVELDVVNPDGQTSERPGRVGIFSGSSLGAPLEVRSAAVLYPSPGALVGEAPVRPRGVLVVSGSGPVIVSWRLDGVPFERAVVQARGGEAVQVDARMPIPRSHLGQHLLQLTVEAPVAIASRPTAILQVDGQTERYRPLGPPDGLVMRHGTAPLLSWTQVPAAAGYQVEIVADDGLVAARWPARQARLRPSAAQIASLAPGRYGWRAVPRFPGEVTGEPIGGRTLIVIPESVALAATFGRDTDTGRAALEWTGGALGLVYRVEQVAEDGGVVFSALTARPRYVLPAPAEPSGLWRVTALDPAGRALGQSAERAAPDELLTRLNVRLASGTAIQLLDRRPADGAVEEENRPLFRVAWDSAVAADDVLMLVNTTDVTQIATLGPRSLEYEPLLPLERGEHAVTLILGSQTFEWSFSIAEVEAAAPGGEAPEADAAAAAEPTDSRASWQVDAEGTVSWLDGDDLPESESEAYAALSFSGESRGGRAFVQGSGDVSARQVLAPGDLFEEQNRSWVIEAGAEQARTSQELTLGYMEPEFLVGGELITAGLPKGGAQATLAAGPLQISYYEAFDPDLEGVVTGYGGTEQEVRAAALELPGTDGPLELRLIGLEVEEAGDGFFTGGEGSLFGLIGAWRFGAASSLTIEVARGEFTPEPAGVEPASEGGAYRLGLAALGEVWNLDLSLRYVEPEFVNPANRGLAIGGTPDRAGADLRLDRIGEKGSFSFGLRYLDGGTGSGLSDPDSSQAATDLRVTRTLGQAAEVSLGANYARTESAADDELFLPEVEQTDWGVELGFRQGGGLTSFSQDFLFQSSDDALDPERFSDTAQVTLSAQHSGERFSLYGSLGGIRTRLGSARATTDSLLASVQPSWTWEGAGVSLLPYASYSVISDESLSGDTTDEQYRLTVSWSPPRWSWLRALELTADWSRSEGPFAFADGFVASYTASLSIGWGWDSSSSRRAAPPPAASTLPAASLLRLRAAGPAAHGLIAP